MRKAIGLNVVVLVIAMVFTGGTAFAGNVGTGNQAPSGPHFNINIIGHPKGGIGGDDSSGHSIMIPLRNVPGTDKLECMEGVVVDDDKGQTTTVEPTGARIYFERSDHFEIIDRDATDSNGARIKVPVGDPDPLTGDMPAQFDVYIRVLGKPNQCMHINAYAYDVADQTTWYQAGTVYVSRKPGKSTFVRVNELFTICIVDATGQCGGYRSAFNTVFDGYFWSIFNDGTRLVQVRLYQK